MVQDLTLDTLYEFNDRNSTEQFKYGNKISFRSGTVRSYTSDSDTEPANKASMEVSFGDEDVPAGSNAIKSFPKWLCVEQLTGSSVDIKLFGASYNSKGVIS